MKIVLQKLIASRSQYSRRQAEELIRFGRVRVNDIKAELGMKVEKNVEIKIDGKKLIDSWKPIYLKLNKPVGYTCTSRRFPGEKNVFDLVKTDERLFVVGRLDKNSRGLVVLTNDGDWALELTHPRYGHDKEYLVTVAGQCELSGEEAKKVIDDLRAGVDIGEYDGRVKAKKIRYLGNNQFNVVLAEGRKRQIRRMMREVGLDVKDLLRVRIGEILLGDLTEGKTAKIDKIKQKL